ncbi:MAG: protocatechuate 3,4-dioxygenase subunit beta [Betaproteobacteria bacterium]|nr:protocatechuate 3,4-dioxygenase subunit beta [Betaproteobacteria bacterium]
MPNRSPLRRVVPGTHPPMLYPDYRSTPLRAPAMEPVGVAQGPGEISVVPPPRELVVPLDADLTRQSTGAPLGERIIVTGCVRDEDGEPVRDSLVEIWQCNAAGRYAHPADQHDAPLDPNFVGRGKALTDDRGEYRFLTIRPGAYPWRNHPNAWRPAHIHFSLFGNAYAQRLVTQMYFPGDPLLAFDPIFLSVPEAARPRLVSAFDPDVTQPEVALGFRFDIVLRGRGATPTGI